MIRETFPQMAEILQPGRVGVAAVEHFKVTSHDANMAAFRRINIDPGKYAKLTVDGDLMMSDTRDERITNYRILSDAHGHVLIAGLGLGMILHPILKKPEVRSVLVVEKYQDVIDLISPSLDPAKLTIECGDIFTWKPTKGRKFNVIYNDIWPDITTENLPEIAKLHQREKTWVDRSDPECSLRSWMQDSLRAQRQRERTYERYGLLAYQCGRY